MKSHGLVFRQKQSTLRRAAFWLSFLTASLLYAQRIPFHHYSIEDGLIQSTVMSLFQDGSGFLWIGTAAGVSRFDGLEFVNYNFEDGLANDVVRAMAQDRAGRIWLATEGGVTLFAGGSFTNFGAAEGVPHDSVRCIVEDTTGTLWFGTYGGGIVFFRDGRFREVEDAPEAMDDMKILAGTRDREGNLWFGGIDTGLVQIRDGKVTVHSQAAAPVFDSVRALLDHPSLGLLVGAEHGLYVFDGTDFSSLEQHAYLSDLYVQALMLDAQQRLWVGTRENGVFRFHRGNVDHFTTKQGLSNNGVKTIMQDRDDNVWLGTYGGGLCRLSHENFQVFTAKEGLPFENVYCITQDRDKRMWFGTNDGGAIILDNAGEFATLSTHDWIGTSKVLSLLVDHSGQVWVGTLKGVHCYDAGTVTTLTQEDGLAHDIVYSMQESPTGDVWFGTYGGLTRKSGRKFKTFTTTDGLPHNRINYVMMSKEGDVWLATGDGLCRFREGVFRTWKPADGLAGSFVLHLMEDSKGAIWACTTQGLSRFQDGSFRNFTRADGLTSSRSSVALEGENGTIWIGTNQGINMFDGRLFRSVTVRDGISSDEVNRGAGFRDQRGALWFGTVRGITKFKPNARFDEPAAPLVYIEKMRYFDEYLPMKPHLVLPHFKNHLAFEYLCTSFRSPTNVTYRYRLAGLSEQWHDITQRTVQFAALPPGSYTFQLKARNGSGPWSPTVAQYPFRIAPPIWLTWWAKCLYVLFAGMAILGYVWSQSKIKQSLARRVAERTAELQGKNEEVLRTQRQLLSHEKMASLGTLTAGIAHEIKNPLNFVNNFSEISLEYLAEIRDALAARSETGDDEPMAKIGEAVQELEKNCQLIRHHGNRANDIVRSMMNLARGETGEPQDVDINVLVEQFADLAFHGKQAEKATHEVEMRKDLDVSVGTHRVVPSDLGRVLINLVNNAIEALTEEGHVEEVEHVPIVEVATKRRDDVVEIRVRDNGPGIPPEKRDAVFTPFFTTKQPGSGNVGLGLSMSYDIVVHQHQGKISVSSELGEYTEFVIQLPRSPE